MEWKSIHENLNKLPQTRCLIYDGMFIRQGFHGETKITRGGEIKSEWYGIHPPYEEGQEYNITHFIAMDNVPTPKT